MTARWMVSNVPTYFSPPRPQLWYTSKQWTASVGTGKAYVQVACRSGTRSRPTASQGSRGTILLRSISAPRKTCLGIRFYVSGNIRNHVTNDRRAKTVWILHASAYLWLDGSATLIKHCAAVATTGQFQQRNVVHYKSARPARYSY